MSVVFNLDELKGKEIKIDKLLTFTPKSFVFNKFSNRDMGSVKMYIAEEKKIYIPYRFACSLFSKIYKLFWLNGGFIPSK